MRLVLVDVNAELRANFYPLSFCRPIWQLRCGITSLAEKLIAKTGASDVACFVPDYMAASYSAKTDMPVNDVSKLAGDDLLLVDPRVKTDSLDATTTGPSEVALDDEGNVLYARIAKDDLAKLDAGDVSVVLGDIGHQGDIGDGVASAGPGGHSSDGHPGLGEDKETAHPINQHQEPGRQAKIGLLPAQAHHGFIPRLGLRRADPGAGRRAGLADCSR